MEIKLKNKTFEIAKLDRQLREKLVNHKRLKINLLMEKNQVKICDFFVVQDQFAELKQERDLLEIQLQAEIRNSNRLNRNVDELSLTKRELLDRIDRMKSEHIEEMRQRLEKPKKPH